MPIQLFHDWLICTDDLTRILQLIPYKFQIKLSHFGERKLLTHYQHTTY